MHIMLVGKTAKGKQRIKRDGKFWNAKIQLDVPPIFAPGDNGPWFMVESFTTNEGRWVRKTDDVDFEVIPVYFITNFIDSLLPFYEKAMRDYMESNDQELFIDEAHGGFGLNYGLYLKKDEGSGDMSEFWKILRKIEHMF